MKRQTTKTDTAEALDVAETPAPAPIVKASDARIRANRRNAALSTGPRTPEGKRIARWNATRHGLLSAAVVLPDESEADFRSLRDHLRADLQPMGAVEELLTDRIVSLAWRLRRLGRVEGEILRWAQAEAERLRWEACSRRYWRDAEKRAGAEARGTRMRYKYKEPRRRKERTGLRPTPRVDFLDFSMEAVSAGRISGMDKPDADNNPQAVENYSGAMFELEAGKSMADYVGKFADEYEEKRDSDDTALGRGFTLETTDKALDKLSRYETTTDRAFHRTLERLLRLQAARGAGGLVLEAEPEREPRG